MQSLLREPTRQFDEATATSEQDVQALIFVVWDTKEPKHARDSDVIHLLNEVTRAKAKLVRAGQLSAERFVAEVEEVSRRYHTQLSVAGYRHLGELLDQAGQWDLALQYYETASVRQPDDPDLLNNIGVVHSRLGRNARAVEVLQRALTLRPAYHKALSNLGIALSESGKRDEALDAFNRSLKLKPDYGAALVNRANLLFELKRYEEAVADLQLAARNESQFKKQDLAHLYNGLGVALATAGRREESIPPLMKGLELGADAAHSWFDLAMVYAILHRFTDAERALKALHESPGAREFLRDSGVRAAVNALMQDIASEAMDALLGPVKAKGDVRFEEERQRMRQLGIIDEKNEPRTQEVPADMRPGSRTDIST